MNKSKENVGGRKRHDYYAEDHFKRVEGGALCLYCNKVQQNTGIARLKAHRGVCSRLSPVPSSNHSPVLSPRPSPTKLNKKNSDLYAVPKNPPIPLEVPSTSNAPALPDGTISTTPNTECLSTTSEVTSSSTALSTPFRRKRRGMMGNFIDTISTKEQENIDLAIAKLVFAHGLDFSIVESLHFQRMLKVLRPACKCVSVQDLSTKLLSKVYEDVAVAQRKVAASQNSSLMIATSKKTDDSQNIITATAVIKTEKGEQLLFLGSREPTEGQSFETPENEIINDSIVLGIRKFSINIYAIVLESKSMERGVIKREDMWYFVNNNSLVDSVASEIEDPILTQKVTEILEEFQTEIVKAKIKDYGGNIESDEGANGWRIIEKRYSDYLDNLPYLKKVVANDSLVDLRGKIVYLYDIHFEEELRRYVDIFKALQCLSKQCEDPKCTLADITEEWLKFEQLCAKNNIDSIDFDDMLTPQAMAANFYHPYYQGHFFIETDDKTKFQKMTEFVVAQLVTEEGLKGHSEYRNKSGIFKSLFTRKLRLWSTFWDVAVVYYPELTAFIRKLLQVPVMTLKLDFVDISTNHLTPIRSQKFVDVHHHLRLQKSDDLKEEE